MWKVDRYLSHCSIALKRYHEHSNKEKHYIMTCLHFRGIDYYHHGG